MDKFTSGKSVFSKRTIAMPTSPIRGLVPHADAAMKSGKKVLFLNIGQPDVPTPRAFFDGVASFNEPVLAYGTSHGRPELIEAVVSHYRTDLGVPLEPRDVLVTAGGSEALQFAIMLLCDPGDEIIVPEPFYANYASICASALVKIVPVTTRAEEGYHLPGDPAERRGTLEKLVTERTKAILLSHPGNPTGTVYTPDELRCIVDVARERNLFIIADEVYRDFVYDDVPYESFASFEDAADRVIIIDSVSKRYSACGARIGFLISRNRELMAHGMKYAQARGCTAILEQIGAAALYSTPESFLRDVRKEYAARRDILCDALSSIPGVTFRKPEGAFYLSARLPVADTTDFAIWAVKECAIDGETILVAPLSGFYATPGLGTDEIRLCYALERDVLMRAGAILKKAVATWPENRVPAS